MASGRVLPLDNQSIRYIVTYLDIPKEYRHERRPLLELGASLRPGEAPPHRRLAPHGRRPPRAPTLRAGRAAPRPWPVDRAARRRHAGRAGLRPAAAREPRRR